jgi:hypothetical protein
MKALQRLLTRSPLLDLFFMAKPVPERYRAEKQTQSNKDEEQRLEDHWVVPAIEVAMQTLVIRVVPTILDQVCNELDAAFDQDAAYYQEQHVSPFLEVLTREHGDESEECGKSEHVGGCEDDLLVVGASRVEGDPACGRYGEGEEEGVVEEVI